jgi:hypothetical protein
MVLLRRGFESLLHTLIVGAATRIIARTVQPGSLSAPNHCILVLVLGKPSQCCLYGLLCNAIILVWLQQCSAVQCLVTSSTNIPPLRHGYSPTLRWTHSTQRSCFPPATNDTQSSFPSRPLHHITTISVLTISSTISKPLAS